MCEMTPTRIRSNAVGHGGGTSLAWDDAVISLHRSMISIHVPSFAV
jgi:hypothetical protein